MLRTRKPSRQERAAAYVADLILDSLEQYPAMERRARLRKIHTALSAASGKRPQPAPKGSIEEPKGNSGE